MIDEEDYIGETVDRWITFKLGTESYGIKVKHVREILRVNNIFPVPGSHDCVLGITNIRGSVVTIINGRKRLNLPDQEYDDSTRIIVVEVNDDVAGLLVDNVIDVIDLPKTATDMNSQLNAQENSEYIDGVVTLPERLIIMLNIQSLFSDGSEPCAMASGF